MLNKSEVNRILVITLSNAGDIILTTPVVESLIAEFPHARLDVMVGPSGKEIFENHPRLSNLILYHKKSSPLEKLTLFIKLRREKYDLIVDLRNTILPFVLGAKWMTSPFRTHSKNSVMHKKDIHLLRLKNIGIDISGARFYIAIRESDKQCVEGLLLPLGGEKYVVISPGAKSHLKRWPLKNFAVLADMIKNELGLKVVLVGDIFDRVVGERIMFYTETKPLNLIEKTSIPQLAYIIAKSALLVTNDSAPLHLGSAVGSRILAFFGPTNPKEYGPVTGAGSRVLARHISCSPCRAAQCINAQNKYECLKSISAEEAFQAVKELLRTGS